MHDLTSQREPGYFTITQEGIGELGASEDKKEPGHGGWQYGIRVADVHGGVDEILWNARYGAHTVDSADVMDSAGEKDAQAGEEGMHDVKRSAWEYEKIVGFLSGGWSDQLRYS